MKFLQTEHDAFEAVIEKSQFNYAQFSFSKKKGWLSVNHKGFEKSFQYHRKTETHINDAGRWIESKIFYVQVGNTKKSFESFEEILEELTTWLKTNK